MGDRLKVLHVRRPPSVSKLDQPEHQVRNVIPTQAQKWDDSAWLRNAFSQVVQQIKRNARDGSWNTSDENKVHPRSNIYLPTSYSDSLTGTLVGAHTSLLVEISPVAYWVAVVNTAARSRSEDARLPAACVTTPVCRAKRS